MDSRSGNTMCHRPVVKSTHFSHKRGVSLSKTFENISINSFINYEVVTDNRQVLLSETLTRVYDSVGELTK